MQGHVKMDGFEFEPVDEKRSKCSVCQKVINKLLQKAHANIHSSLLTAKIDINKLPPSNIPEISPAKSVKRTSIQLEDHVTVGLDPKRPVLSFDDILSHRKNLKKPEVNCPANKVQNLIPKKLNPITDKNQQGQGNERNDEHFPERQNDTIDKKSVRGLTASVMQPGIFVMLNNTCSQNQVCLPQKNALERLAESPDMQKKQKTSSLSFYIKKSKQCEYYLQRLVKINTHSIYIQTLKAMRIWKKLIG